MKRVKPPKDPILTALETLIDLIKNLDRRIADLNIQQPAVVPQIPIPNNVPWISSYPCSAGGFHEYPFPWYATIPPCCKKCGRQAASFPITCNGGVTVIYNDSTLTGDHDCINKDEGIESSTELTTPSLTKAKGSLCVKA